MSKKVLRFSRSFMFSSLRLKLSSILRFLVMWESSRFFGMRTVQFTQYQLLKTLSVPYHCILAYFVIIAHSSVSIISQTC